MLADEAGGRLFIADSNHNRIVVADARRQAARRHRLGADRGRRTATSPRQLQPSARHGARAATRCTWPTRRTTCCARSIWRRKRVTTIAGTGEQGQRPGRRSAGRAIRRFARARRRRSTARGPCGFTDEDLYIAMAGPHQIWKMPLDGREIGPYAGNGREDIVDGPLLPPQPYATGYSVVRPAQRPGVRRQVAVRGRQRRELDPRGAVRSGRPGRNGRRRARARCSTLATSMARANAVRLQHPLGVVYHEGKLYVADTYNNKVKVLDVATRECETFVGTGQVGSDDADDGGRGDVQRTGRHHRGRRQTLRSRYEQSRDPRDRTRSAASGDDADRLKDYGERRMTNDGSTDSRNCCYIRHSSLESNSLPRCLPHHRMPAIELFGVRRLPTPATGRPPSTMPAWLSLTPWRLLASG